MEELKVVDCHYYYYYQSFSSQKPRSGKVVRRSCSEQNFQKYFTKHLTAVYFSFLLTTTHCCDTGVSGLTRGLATLPQDNQDETLVVRTRWEEPGELGVNKSMECDVCPSVL